MHEIRRIFDSGRQGQRVSQSIQARDDGGQIKIDGLAYSLEVSYFGGQLVDLLLTLSAEKLLRTANAE